MQEYSEVVMPLNLPG